MMRQALFGMFACVLLVSMNCGGDDPPRDALYGAYLNDESHAMNAVVVVQDDASYAEVRLYEEVVANDDGEHPLYVDVRYEGDLQVAAEHIREIAAAHIPVFTAPDGSGGTVLRAAFTTDDRTINVRGLLVDGRDALRISLTVDNVPLGELVLARQRQSHFTDNPPVEE